MRFGRAARGLTVAAVIIAGIVTAALLAGPRGQDGPPLDPASTGPTGTKALVDTLSAVGADVRVTAEPPGPDVRATLLLSDLLDEPERAQLRAWVDAGGVLVVADPRSELTPDLVGVTAFGFIDAPIAKRCDLPALRDVQRIAAPGGGVYEATDTACFPRNDGAWLVAKPSGRGAIVSLGGPTAFVNDELGQADNALLAVALLAPRGQGRVAIMRPPGPGEGEATLGELLDPRVRAALWQLALAFAIFAAWRARRLGRPVLEPTAVRIPGSELVVALGHLFHEARGRARAAALLRADLHSSLAERLGLPPAAPIDAIAAAAVARTPNLDAVAVRSALDGPVPASDEDLVRFGRDVEQIRRAALGDPPR
jgi:hypothetical protein